MVALSSTYSNQTGLRLKSPSLFQVPSALQSRYIATSMANMSDKKYIEMKLKGDIAVIKIDIKSAKQNTLNREMLPEFASAFEEATKNDKVKGIVVISGKTNSFIAGADVNMIQSCKTKDEVYQIAREGQRIMGNMEASQKPVVAAIMGSCLGGGLEVALATHYRVAVNDSKTVLGLPEVKLGLLPGSGGTQRLPRLVCISCLIFSLFDFLIKKKF